MNRTHRRKLDKEIRRLAMAEQCSICKKPLTNGAKTWGGIARSGATAYVSDCCLPQMKVLDSYGIFATYVGLTMAERKDPDFFDNLSATENFDRVAPRCHARGKSTESRHGSRRRARSCDDESLIRTQVRGRRTTPRGSRLTRIALIAFAMNFSARQSQAGAKRRTIRSRRSSFVRSSRDIALAWRSTCRGCAVTRSAMTPST